jgi:uncharacterized protein DUF3551
MHERLTFIKELRHMRRNLTLAFLVLASSAAVAGSLSPAAAGGTVQDSYCLQGRQSGYPGNCEFSSYQQCMATASGTGEGCGINPMKAYARPSRYGYQGRY